MSFILAAVWWSLTGVEIVSYLSGLTFDYKIKDEIITGLSDDENNPVAKFGLNLFDFAVTLFSPGCKYERFYYFIGLLSCFAMFGILIPLITVLSAAFLITSVLWIIGPGSVLTVTLEVIGILLLFLNIVIFICKNYLANLLCLLMKETYKINPQLEQTFQMWQDSLSTVSYDQFSMFDPKTIIVINGREFSYSELRMKEHLHIEKLVGLIMMRWFPNFSVMSTNIIIIYFCLLIQVFPMITFMIKTSARVSYYFTITILSLIVIGMVSSKETLCWFTEMFFIITYLPFEFVFYLNGKGWRKTVMMAKYKFIKSVLKFYIQVETFKAWNKAFGGKSKGFNIRKEKKRAYLNKAFQSFQILVDEFALPNFIRTLPDAFDVNAINETQEILARLGWPTSDKIIPGRTEDLPLNLNDESVLIGTVPSIKQGVLRLKLDVDSDLENLKGLAPEFVRSESFTTIENELKSISRYFDEDCPLDTTVDVNDVWVIAGDIFRNSRLVDFKHIISKWNLKFGLGPFWRRATRDGSWRKLSRKSFINSIGGIHKFLKLWYDTFELSPSLTPVAPVSVKGEALPLKKYINDAVRTVVGSPIVHYIMSTVWNYHPNHNFRYWSTNIKIGMPLNGINMGQLISEHFTFDNHFAGDFSAFDSTLRGKIIEIIKQVRKKGFEHHRDYAKICFLIDANYKALLKTPLMTTSTGAVYEKKSGLSTGHSSTSMDNSLACLILYLIAWKDLTGLSAHEFRFFNKLSNFGDDHILSWRSTAPPVWRPQNMIDTMKRYGVVLRDEAPNASLLQMSFLSKNFRFPNDQDIKDLKSAGVRVPHIIAIHNPDRLIGKAYAPTSKTRTSATYRVNRLISYLTLCAHQPAIYDKIRFDIDMIMAGKGKRPSDAKAFKNFKTKIPSYSDVLRSWYDEKTNMRQDIDTPVSENELNDTIVYTYTSSLGLDSLVRVLSVLPDVVNPAIYNVGYVKYALNCFDRHLTWPLELVKRSNDAHTIGHLSDLIKRTPYEFLHDSTNIMIMNDKSSNDALITRNWIYIFISQSFIKFGPLNALGWIDKQIASLNFVINGHVTTMVHRYDLPLFEILLVALLSKVPGIPNASKLVNVKFPSFSSVLEGVYSIIMNTLWSKVPPNMKEAKTALQNLDSVPEIILEAPTGSGKSTSFVSYVHKLIHHDYERIILVLPRRILVTNLVEYLNKMFGLDFKPVTSGFKFNDSYRCVATTSMEVFLHPQWLNEKNLFIVDEFHLQEALNLGLIDLLRKAKAKRILMSATPSFIKGDNSIYIPLTIASTWETRYLDTIKMPNKPNYNYFRNDYHKMVLQILKPLRHLKILIFVLDIKDCDNLSQLLPLKCCVLNSRSTVIDLSAQYYIATSVADVGLTIPDVDLVVTSNIVWHSNPSTKSENKPILTKINKQLIRQRAGRTGRTKHGMFQLIEFDDLPGLSDVMKWNEISIANELFKAGTSASLINKFWPNVIDTLWMSEQEEADRPAMNEFIATLYDDLMSSLSIARDSDLPPDCPNINTFNGNTMSTSNFQGGQPIPATIAEMTKYALIASLLFVFKEGVTSLSIEKSEYFWRSAHVSTSSLCDNVERVANMTTEDAKEDLESMGHPTGRFGRAVAGIQPLSFDLLHGFGNPINADTIDDYEMLLSNAS
jgi:late competence protein required for DNA uptake (superfamily II DNA/RNA helicase)